MSMLRIFILILLALNALAFAATQGWLGGATPRNEPERITNQLAPERIRLTSDSPAQGLQAPLASEAATADPIPETGPLPTAEATTQSPETGPAEPATVPLTIAAAQDDSMAPTSEQTLESTSEPAPASTPEPTPTSLLAPAQPDTAAQAAETAAATPPPPVLSCVVWSGLSQADADALARRLRRSGTDFDRSRNETPTSWWVRVPPQSSREQAERRAIELRALGVNDMFIVQEDGPTQYAISLGVFKTENRARQLLNQLRSQGVRNAGAEPRMSTTYRIQATVATDALRGIESGVRNVASHRTNCTRR